ncbi:O-antigen ligase family protein [Winogradskyella sp.]|uniref:O-antigen ligase family protein n=1 Tax=Winogradskyella sp. TaxID=1883156 RepID=UPI003BA9CDB4
MYLRTKWKITDKNTYKLYYEYALGVLAGVLVFRVYATPLIFLFILLSVLFYNQIKYSRKSLLPIFIISLPLLLNIVFIWNNDSLYEGIKQLEKYSTCLFFPLLLLFQPFKISINKVFRAYSIVFTSILVVCFFLHFLTQYDLFVKYINGELVWQMGYNFALSMELHAPALNMHVAFLVIVNLYLLLSYYLKKKSSKLLAFRVIIFLVSVLILLFINTRIAIVNAFIGIVLVSSLVIYNHMPKKKALKIISLITGTIIVISLSFILLFPYVIKKYSKLTFKHMDKIGQLDTFENPEAEVYSALVTRVSIWKTTVDVISSNVIFGVGCADGKKELIKAYKQTNQKFLAKYEFPVHNQYLDFFLKFGIFGFLAVNLYIFYPLYIFKKGRKPYVLFFFILFFTSNLTDDFLVRYDGIVFSALWVSIFSNNAFSSREINEG